MASRWIFYRDRGDAVRALFLLMALCAYICLDFTMHCRLWRRHGIAGGRLKGGVFGCAGERDHITDVGHAGYKQH